MEAWRIFYSRLLTVCLWFSLGLLQLYGYLKCSFCVSSRGLGSGMDSRSESDGHEGSDSTTPPLLHAAGDGSNDTTGRPGLEGANSDAEDIPSVGRLPLDTSSRLEAQGLGKLLL